MPAVLRSSPLTFHRLVTFVIIAAGAIGAIFSYRAARHEEYERAEAQFVRRSTVQYALSREVLRRYEEALFGLSLFFTLDVDVSLADFVRAASRVEQRIAGAHALEWVPVVTHEDRPALEATMQRAVDSRFQIVQFDARGQPIRATERPLYYPICYIYPLRGNELALGYDLKTGPSLAFLEKARETQRMLVTHPLRLVQESAERPGVIMICPVYRVPRAGGSANDSAGPAATTPPTEVFAGFLQCVFRVHELLEQARSAQPDSVLDILFIDGSETAPAKRVLY